MLLLFADDFFRCLRRVIEGFVPFRVLPRVLRRVQTGSLLATQCFRINFPKLTLLPPASWRRHLVRKDGNTKRLSQGQLLLLQRHLL